ncbi:MULTISPECIES: class I adenylate-forming enzyme family protein [unclassified Mycobacterium]|uniref:class I adenylate-forming enzyme family protein n=1 Tax=unclassified Mycobacterium TaxID=2642494 RepID=UPI0007403DAB|nr:MULTISPECIES: class I adenylate-forming enzyme family protein [unclassified Mycobacterium]KUH87744.1 hypothetical protein AU185_04690 [Mycobacterium sp. GA-0227b]KUH87791.1 hypothetical protein AU186_03675 [Mycobacterium sp. GA-1999]KUH88683.1 hypothetical protein AU187_07025 [Mycobacterium sp. IS-1556]
MVNDAEATAILTAPGAPFEMENIDVAGQTMRAYRNAPPTMRAVFESMDQYAERDAVLCEGECYTYADQRRIVARFSHVLTGQLGVRPGDRVALASRNGPEFIFSFWSTQVLGAVSVPLNAWWTTEELENAIRSCEPKVVIVDGERWQRLSDVWQKLPVAHWVVVRPDGPLPDTAHRWEVLLASAPEDPQLPTVDVTPTDPATILFTAGSTGRPKGVVSTNRNHCMALMNMMYFGALSRTKADLGLQPTEQAVSLNPFPLFHIGGLLLSYTAAATGSKLILMPRWDTEEALRLCEQEHVTTLASVPTLLHRILEAPELEKYKLSSLGAVTSGAAPLPPSLAARLQQKFGGRVIGANGFGVTETTGGISANAGEDYFAQPQCVGAPFPIVDVCVVDQEGNPLDQGHIGELWVRGSNVASGYWRDPEATAQAFSNRWFHSGDLARIDEQGRMTIVDRLKDVVIRGGENVYGIEVESVLQSCPGVEDVAVIGLPHQDLGEEVAAVVVLKDSQTTVEELQQFAARQLAAFKVPSAWILREEPLPRNAAGKVLKRELRQVAHR